MPIEATLNAYPEWKIPGDVIAVIPAADRSKATVRVRVSLGLKDPRIVPEMGVRVRFLEARSDVSAAKPAPLGGVLVPKSAVIERDGRAMAYVVENGRASARELTVAATIADFRNVTAGLLAGQTVIVNPPAELVDGAPITSGK